jgi:hypothetical protein
MLVLVFEGTIPCKVLVKLVTRKHTVDTEEKSMQFIRESNHVKLCKDDNIDNLDYTA